MDIINNIAIRTCRGETYQQQNADLMKKETLSSLGQHQLIRNTKPSGPHSMHYPSDPLTSLPHPQINHQFDYSLLNHSTLDDPSYTYYETILSRVKAWQLKFITYCGT